MKREVKEASGLLLLVPKVPPTSKGLICTCIDGPMKEEGINDFAQRRKAAGGVALLSFSVRGLLSVRQRRRIWERVYSGWKASPTSGILVGIVDGSERSTVS